MIKDDEAQGHAPTIARVRAPSRAPFTTTAAIDFRLGDTAATTALPSPGPNHGRCQRDDNSGVTVDAMHTRSLDRRCKITPCRSIP
jgi:hypothetical protein